MRGGPEGDRGRCWSDGLTLAGQGVTAKRDPVRDKTQEIKSLGLVIV